MNIWGLCPTCSRWFPCDDFYDQGVAIPTCPSCAHAPTKLSYGRRPIDLTDSAPATELWVG